MHCDPTWPINTCRSLDGQFKGDVKGRVYSITLDHSSYPEHDGKYTCVAQNQVGMASKTIAVNVRGNFFI